MPGMAGTLEDDFSKMITDCRSALHRWRSSPLTKLGLRSPLGAVRDAHNDAMRAEYLQLLLAGDVVWGALSQVNNGMFEPGAVDLPGVTVYSTDPCFDGRPQDLNAIGSACFALKNTAPEDPELLDIAERLTNEYDHTIRKRLPRKLTDGRVVYMGATMFHRGRIPGGVLAASAFPLVIVPERTEVNMVLPLRFWSKMLKAEWDNLNDLLSRAPVGTEAMFVVRKAKKVRITPGRPDWDTQRFPVKLLPGMIHWMRAQAPRLMNDHNPILFVGVHPDGEKFADLTMTEDDPLRVMFDFEGIRVQVLKAQLEEIRGTQIDYRDDAFGAGLIIRLPGE